MFIYNMVINQITKIQSAKSRLTFNGCMMCVCVGKRYLIRKWITTTNCYSWVRVQEFQEIFVKIQNKQKSKPKQRQRRRRRFVARHKNNNSNNTHSIIIKTTTSSSSRATPAVFVVILRSAHLVLSLLHIAAKFKASNNNHNKCARVSSNSYQTGERDRERERDISICHAVRSISHCSNKEYIGLELNTLGSHTLLVSRALSLVHTLSTCTWTDVLNVN